MVPPRHFLDLHEIPADQLKQILVHAKAMKAERKLFKAGKVEAKKPLTDRVLAMIFDRPSTRTRISFDLGMRDLGGQTLMLTGTEMQLGRGESIADTARVLSRFVDAIMIRILDSDDLKELARHASVPVINGLTKKSHPCQVMADIMTFEEHRGAIKGATIAWSGDSNNVLESLIHAAHVFDFSINIATPEELAPNQSILRWAQDHRVRLTYSNDPYQAVKAADAIVTDCWVSMGDEEEGRHRHNLLKAYQVNKDLMRVAKPDAVFMHCLPAHRGEEVTDEIIDGPQSIVFDEAENRLHAQKGILAWCMSIDHENR